MSRALSLTRAIEIAADLRSRGFQSWLVGGCVRDLILGREPKDYDISTDARPEELLQLFPKAQLVGAQFGVTPGLTPELAAAARGARFPLLPGVMTPMELIAARHVGFEVLQLFPAQQAGGIGMLQALAAPFPDIQFCPSGGITRATAPDYLALPNVVCVGGSWVAPRDMMTAGDWAGIEGLARDAAALRSAAK